MRKSFVCFRALSILVLCHFLTAAISLTAGSDASNLIALTAGLKDPTLSIPVPPRGFDLTYEIGGPKLRITSCLMNAIAALKEIALGDWDKNIFDGTEYRLDDYPEVSITITTMKRKRSIQARFVMWAICLGVFDMISKKKFEFAQFEMSWEEQVLGWVQIVNQPADVASLPENRQANETLEPEDKATTLLSSNSAVRLGPLNITNIITMDNENDPAEARLNVTLWPDGGTLGIYDVFVPIMSGLTDMAMSSSTHQAPGLFVGLEGFNGYISIIAAIPLRTSPPFMDYGWLIRTIARIPAYMLETRRFGEINIHIEVDGIFLGFGRLTTKPNRGVSASLPTASGVAGS